METFKLYNVFYEELSERLEYLQAQEQTEEIKFRTLELTLVIVRIQQMFLKTIDNKV